MQIIYFNSRTPEWEWLSNFYYAPMLIEGECWDTVEHLYQAMKCKNPEDREEIRSCSSPHEAKRMGKLVPCRDNWDKVKLEKMLLALRLKFQIPSLQRQLRETGDALLVHLSPWDLKWGVDKFGRGENHLGQLLMVVRGQSLED